MSITFTKQNTNIAKGVAILFMFLQHLFYSTSYPYIKLNILNIDIWFVLAILGKICVSIFVILSGFGLYKSFFKNESVLDFFKKRFSYIYSNYWFIWLLFVPLGVYFFGYNLETVYDGNVLKHLLIDLTGTQIYFNFFGINSTWWFISLLITLYLFFPLLYKISKFKYLLEILFLASYSLYFFRFDEFWMFETYSYFFSFIAGILIAKYSIFEKISEKPNIWKFISIISILVFSTLRCYKLLTSTEYVEAGTQTCFDPFVGFALIVIFYLCYKNNKLFFLLEELGKYSFIIFLFHKFLMIYCPYYVFGLDYPIFILLNFILVNYALAKFISLLKDKFDNNLYKLKCLVCRR
jgi:surface polysaccharide O-acyltransferase-like enzyme